ncbi:MAG: hypothetical protein RL556_258 [Actinomycetota bacterium]|jgi:DNA-binding NarL/FixJ family response regulator
MVIKRKVLIVEDDNMLRNLLALKLTTDGFEVSSAANAKTAITEANDFDPDIALLDIDLGAGPNGIDLAQHLSKNFPGLAVIFLTNVPEPKVVARESRSIPKGAAYLVKHRLADTNILNEAIEAAIRDRVPALFRNDKDSNHPLSALSKTQLAVVRQIAIGLTNAQIAEHRGTTIRSVELLIRRTVETLGLANDGDSKNFRVMLAREYIKVAGVPENDVN